MIKGIAASAGVSISKVFKLQHPEVNVEKREANAEEEIARLHSAIEATQKDIEAIKANAIGRLSDEELAIFDAHLMVSQDPELVGQIEELIKSENVNADFATNQVATMFVGMFESMEDEYFRERAADIKDVTYRMLTHILGLVIPDLTAISEEVVIVAEDLTPSDTTM